MKLSDWAKKQGISYKTAWRLYKQGHIKVDCLYPLLGGQAGKPEDWKIEELVVEREEGNWIRIKIYFYEEVR